MLPLAFLLKKVTFKVAEKAIAEQKLTTGIYRFFPVEGEQAVQLAKGYISGVRIVFWFLIFFFPMLFILRLLD
jgi:hypothetical protein